MNFILCKFLECKKVVAKDGRIYYLATILYQSVSKDIFFTDIELFDKFSQLSGFSDIKLYFDVNLRRDGTVSLVPNNIEV